VATGRGWDAFQSFKSFNRFAPSKSLRNRRTGKDSQFNCPLLHHSIAAVLHAAPAALFPPYSANRRFRTPTASCTALAIAATAISTAAVRRYHAALGPVADRKLLAITNAPATYPGDSPISVRISRTRLKSKTSSGDTSLLRSILSFVLWITFSKASRGASRLRVKFAADEA
jgi:hypothetical protein